jgi:Short chain fatty acids transporter
VRALLARLGSLPRTPRQAYVSVFLVAAAASLVTWGLGLVVGALLAREVAAQARARGLRLHFPMLVAAAFSGFVVWHMGFSGSGPLTAATEGSFIAKQLGRTVPISATTFAGWNLLATAATVAAVAGALALAAPREGDPVREVDADLRDAGPRVDEEVVTPADRLDASRAVTGASAWRSRPTSSSTSRAAGRCRSTR